jgi:hypothetical protein
MMGVRVTAGAGNFSLHHSVRGPTQLPWVPRIKQPDREADHSPPSSGEVKNAWSYTSTLQYAFMVWCSVKVQGELNFTLMKLKDALHPEGHEPLEGANIEVTHSL